jgi:hypothetical protein
MNIQKEMKNVMTATGSDLESRTKRDLTMIQHQGNRNDG